MQGHKRETLTVIETAAILGICADTLYVMVKQKQIPHIRVRHRILFRYSTLVLWMAEQEAASCVQVGTDNGDLR